MEGSGIRSRIERQYRTVLPELSVVRISTVLAILSLLFTLMSTTLANGHFPRRLQSANATMSLILNCSFSLCHFDILLSSGMHSLEKRFQKEFIMKTMCCHRLAGSSSNVSAGMACIAAEGDKKCLGVRGS